MKRFVILLCFLNFALTAHAANSPDAGLAEVVDLGNLNGQALACGYADSAAQIKDAMVKFAPKSRRYGAAFEEATNEAFLVQSRKERNTCLDGPTLADRVEKAARRLQAALPSAQAMSAP